MLSIIVITAYQLYMCIGRTYL